MTEYNPGFRYICLYDSFLNYNEISDKRLKNLFLYYKPVKLKFIFFNERTNFYKENSIFNNYCTLEKWID